MRKIHRSRKQPSTRPHRCSSVGSCRRQHYFAANTTLQPTLLCCQHCFSAVATPCHSSLPLSACSHSHHSPTISPTRSTHAPAGCHACSVHSCVCVCTIGRCDVQTIASIAATKSRSCTADSSYLDHIVPGPHRPWTTPYLDHIVPGPHRPWTTPYLDHIVPGPHRT